MILLGLGGNLATVDYGPPRQTLTAALAALAARPIRVLARSRWYSSEPVPPSAQPWFVNAVAVVQTALEPPALLAELLDLERRFGRVRGEPNAPRTLDLDLLDYDGRLVEGEPLVLPHPRLHERRFVLAPLAEVAPGWRHPRLGLGVRELLARLPSEPRAEPFPG
ncbi:MAG TPA: 2-amino-4-hydroxy-6-hydroxymethyldihydropteridine diphosphokinase [Stellaceae bacterium]|nr:2-amino-4-hydroxy-6-hydroxymethyldihydropteridine diphosphokinase [Stellaceae bacterium]